MSIMEDCCVHHVEFGVRDGEGFQRKFVQQYKFFLAATRVTNHIKQWVLKSGSASVLITQELRTHTSQSSDHHPNYVDDYCMGWQKRTVDGSVIDVPGVDSVYNVALRVRNLKNIVERLTRSDVEVLQPIQTFMDKHDGEVSIAVVKSCVGNVIHTLIQDDGYKGVFLPGFVATSLSGEEQQRQLVTHFDHVTFVVNCGESNSILNWYGKNFGMRRFHISREDTDDDGFVIDSEEVGLRLKAFEYWKCAETGLSTGGHPESLKFVIAESLVNQGPNQIDTFLAEHDGPGIQHIGLHTQNIIRTVKQLQENAVEFAEPPYTYYTEVGKLEEICDMGQNVEILRQNGILIDAEADPGEATGESGDNSQLRFLMQKFTRPLFDKNTFFLEVIQRVGARGFGSGNITALWRSVQAYINSHGKDNS